MNFHSTKYFPSPISRKYKFIETFNEKMEQLHAGSLQRFPLTKKISIAESFIIQKVHQS